MNKAADRASRVSFLGLDFDRLDTAAAVRAILARDPAAPLGYVVTPNVDHVVRLDEAADWAELHAAYRDAELCLCDSRILARLARLRGIRLPLAAGSDITAALVSAGLPAGERVLIIGGDATTRDALGALLPGAEIIQHVPPMGLLRNDAAIGDCVAAIVANPARLVLCAVGSPQQEIVAHRAFVDGRATGVLLCIGASIDFLTGRAARAPRWMQRAGVEWLHRLGSDPRRMWGRYVVRGPRIFRLALRR